MLALAVQHEVDVDLGPRSIRRSAIRTHGIVAHDGPHTVGNPQVLHVAEDLVGLFGQALETVVAAERQEQSEPLIEPERLEVRDLAAAEGQAHPVRRQSLRAQHLEADEALIARLDEFAEAGHQAPQG